MIENYLIFTVDEHVYAITVSSVLEVLNFSVPTAVPCALPYIEGLIYSRGQGITVVNLRKRFALPEHPVDKKTKIIVVEVPNPTELDVGRITLYGLVADSVQDVIHLYEHEPADGAECTIPREFISDAILFNDAPLFVLDFNKLFEETRAVNLEETMPQEEKL